MLNTIKVNLLLIGIILMVFGIGMIVVSISIFVYTRHILKEYDEKGKAKLKRFSKQIGIESTMPIYEMTYEDVLYELRSNIGAVEQEYKVGDVVDVWFKSVNPFKFISEVEIDMLNRVNLTFKTLGMFAILPGGISIIVSILLGIFVR